MANLIITVISIALVAVAALMGAYYGGTAFMDGQANAKANQLIGQASQIATAWQLWAVDHGTNNLIDTDFCDGSADLVPNYMNVLPVPPHLGNGTHMPSFQPWKPTDNGTSALTTSACDTGWGTFWSPGSKSNINNSILVYSWENTDSKVCDKIRELAGNVWPGYIDPAGVYQWTAFHAYSTARFDCGYTASNQYAMFYRVFPDIP